MPQTLESFVLVKDGVQYTFTPVPHLDKVVVIHLSLYGSDRYEMPTVEARYLYGRLVKKGYEKW